MQPPLPFFTSDKCKDFGEQFLGRLETPIKNPWNYGSQSYTILEWLSLGKWVTNLDAQKLGTSGDRRLREIMFYLRENGVEIVDEDVKSGNKKWKRHRVAPKHLYMVEKMV